MQPEVQISSLARVSRCSRGGGGEPREADSSVKVFPGAWQQTAGGAGGASDHLHPPGGEQNKDMTGLQPLVLNFSTVRAIYMLAYIKVVFIFALKC